MGLEVRIREWTVLRSAQAEPTKIRPPVDVAENRFLGDFFGYALQLSMVFMGVPLQGFRRFGSVTGCRQLKWRH